MAIALSYLIPYYGDTCRKLPDNCLTSLHRQGLVEGVDYEIVVCRDGSGGTGGARNRALDKAQGEYVMFVDVDDALPDMAIPPLLSLLEQHPEADILSFQPQGAGKALAPETRSYPSGAAYMAKHNFLGTVWRHLYRRELLTRHGIRFAENSLHEDEEFVALAYLHAGQVLISEAEGYIYRRRQDSDSRIQTPDLRLRRVNDFHSLLLRLRQTGTALPTLDKLQQAALQRRLRFLTIDFFRQLLRNRLSPGECRKWLHTLRNEQLLPLPHAPYGAKYALARITLNALSRL